MSTEEEKTKYLGLAEMVANPQAMIDALVAAEQDVGDVFLKQFLDDVAGLLVRYFKVGGQYAIPPDVPLEAVQQLKVSHFILTDSRVVNRIQNSRHDRFFYCDVQQPLNDLMRPLRKMEELSAYVDAYFTETTQFVVRQYQGFETYSSIVQAMPHCLSEPFFQKTLLANLFKERVLLLGDAAVWECAGKPRNDVWKDLVQRAETLCLRLSCLDSPVEV